MRYEIPEDNAVHYSKMKIQGHVLIVEGSRSALITFAVSEEFNAFSLSFDGSVWSLAHPLEHSERDEYKWLYRKMEEADE